MEYRILRTSKRGNRGFSKRADKESVHMSELPFCPKHRRAGFPGAKTVLKSLHRLAFATLTAVGLLHQAAAQTFPGGVIRIVVPYSASTPPDILSRIVADSLSSDEGWKVV